MPTRLIRAGINDSDKIDKLDWAEEVFYRRLLLAVDDYGVFDARTSKLRAELYSSRVDRIREADITRWLAACQKAGLVALYEADGKPYVWVFNTRWQTRSAPKYPLPKEHPLATANGCKQLRTNSLLPDSSAHSSLASRIRGSPPNGVGGERKLSVAEKREQSLREAKK